MSVLTSGFALRVNGSCQVNEVDCGVTLAPFRGCCPAGFFCPSQYNIACCPTSENCTDTLVQKPQCANRTWDLYDNGGYFCCHGGSYGLATTSNSDACASPGYSTGDGEVVLPIISSGIAITSTASSTGSAPTSSSSSNPASTSSKTHPGAIAGGVIGGVVGLALIAAAVWRLARRKHSRKVGNGAQVPEQRNLHEMYNAEVHPERSQLDDQHGLSEMEASAKSRQFAGQHEVSELAG